MTPQELSLEVNEVLMKEKQKKIPFQNFSKKVEDFPHFIKFLIKYGELDTTGIWLIEKEINSIKDEIKLRDIEIAEQELKAVQEKLKRLKG